MKAIFQQSRLLFQKKTVVCIYLFMCGIVLYHFINNVILYQGYDVVGMYHPMHLVTLTSYSTEGFIILQLLPILLVLGTGFVYYSDKTSGMNVFLIERMGKKKYYFSKILSAFFVTFFIFTLPLLLEVILNVLSFPLDAMGDLSNFSQYHSYLIDLIRSYLFYELYLYNPYMYTVFCILLFGIWCGVLAAFVVAISFLPFVKSRLILFLPLYVLIQVLQFIKIIGITDSETTYMLYFYIFEGGDLSETGYLLMLIFLIVSTIGITCWKCREDCRNQ